MGGIKNNTIQDEPIYKIGDRVKVTTPDVYSYNIVSQLGTIAEGTTPMHLVIELDKEFSFAIGQLPIKKITLPRDCVEHYIEPTLQLSSAECLEILDLIEDSPMLNTNTALEPLKKKIETHLAKLHNP